MALIANIRQQTHQDENISKNCFLGAAPLAKDDSEKPSSCARVRDVALRTIQHNEKPSPQRKVLAQRLDRFSLGKKPQASTAPTNRFKTLLYKSMLLPENTKELPLLYARECSKKITAALNENGSFTNSESRTTLESELKETLKDVPVDIQEEVKNSCLTHLKENYRNSSIRSELSKLLDNSMPIAKNRFGQKKGNPVELNSTANEPISITAEDLEMFSHTEDPNSPNVDASSHSAEKPLQKGLEETAVSKWENHKIKEPYISDEDVELFA